MIHLQSSKIPHFLGLADIFIRLGRPKIFEVEPYVNDEYRPDAYTRIDDLPVLIELQRSRISHPKMMDKIDQFVASYKSKQHDARTLWIITDHEYRLSLPRGFTVEQKRPEAI